MNTPLSPKVTFYRVKDNGAKIHLIGTKAQEAFKHEKRLLITVPNFQAAQYIESLLWKSPADSFMPHVVADTSTAEWIAITMQDQNNVNQAIRLLNLSPSVPHFFQEMSEIFELYDETHPEKLELSKQRVQFYQSKGITIKSLDFFIQKQQ